MLAGNVRGLSTLIRSGLVIGGLLTALPVHAADDPRPSETRPSETRPSETRPSETRHTDSDDEVRRKLLLANLPGHAQAGFLNVVPALLGTLFLAGSIASVGDPGNATPTQTAIFTTTNGVLAAAAFGTYLAPRPLRMPLVGSIPPLWFSGLALTLSADPSNSPAENRVLGIAAGTGFVAGMLPLFDALLVPPPDPWAYESDRKALQAADATTLHGAVVRAERNLARTSRPLRIVSPIVYLAGSAAMLIAALDAPQSDHARKTAAGFIGIYSLLATTQAITAGLPSPAENYARALGEFKLVPVGPRGSAGVTAVWRF